MNDWTIEFFVVWNDDHCVELRCDECGHVNHWRDKIEFDEIYAHAYDHCEERHSL